MASLSDVIKVGSSLIRTNEEGKGTLAKAAKKSPTADTSSSPLAAAVAGVSPDSAKMAATPAARLGQVISSSEYERKRQETKPSAPTAAQKKLETLSPLAAVPEQIRASVGQVLASGTITAPKLDESALNSALIPGADPAKAKALAEKATAGSISPAELAELAPMLGLSPSSSPEMIQTKIASLSSSDVGLGNEIAKSLPNTITLASLSPEQKQAAGLNEPALANSLGISPEELSKLTVEELRQKVNAIGRADFSEVSRLQQIASDPNRSPGERAEATSRLRELGSTGVRATEESYRKLSQELERDLTVAIGGQQVPVSEILDDAFLSSSVKAYLDDPVYREKLKEEQPQFAEFIEKNRLALEQASKNLSATAKQLADTQVSNQKLANPGDFTLNEAFLKLSYPNWGALSATPLQPTAAHGILEKYGKTDFGASYGDLLNDLAINDPELAKSMASMTEDDLRAAGLLSKDAVLDYADYVRTARAIETVPDDLQALAELFGADETELQTLVEEAKFLEGSGFLDQTIDSSLLEILDPDGDGKIASPTEIKDTLRQLYGNKLPTEFARGGEPPSLSTQIRDLRAVMEMGQQGILGQIRPYIQDGEVTGPEALEMGKTLSLGELMEARRRLGKSDSLTEAGRILLNRSISEKQQVEWNQKLGGMNFDATSPAKKPSQQEYSQQRNILDRAYQNADTVEEQRYYRSLRDKLDRANPTFRNIYDGISKGGPVITSTNQTGVDRPKGSAPKKIKPTRPVEGR